MKAFKWNKRVLAALFFLLIAGIWVCPGHAGSGMELSSGQTVYVPIYSHIYSGLKGKPFSLAATLSIRNTDPKHPIMLVSVKFYDSEGSTGQLNLAVRPEEPNKGALGYPGDKQIDIFTRMPQQFVAYGAAHRVHARLSLLKRAYKRKRGQRGHE